jgi:hypothetical protein
MRFGHCLNCKICNSYCIIGEYSGPPTNRQGIIFQHISTYHLLFAYVSKLVITQRVCICCIYCRMKSHGWQPYQCSRLPAPPTLLWAEWLDNWRDITGKYLYWKGICQLMEVISVLWLQQTEYSHFHDKIIKLGVDNLCWKHWEARESSIIKNFFVCTQCTYYLGD